MTLDEFVRLADLHTCHELEKTRRLAYFFHKTSALTQFGLVNIREWFQQANYHEPNLTRLRVKINDSKSFVSGTERGLWKLHAVDLDELQALFPGLSSKSEDVISGDAILPLAIYENTRGFIELLAKQINAAHEYRIYDGAAVLMRRLAEILLILSYEHIKIEGSIQDATGNYHPLERIIADAKGNASLKLSRDSKALLEDIRPLGNFAAHKIYYNTRRADLEKIAMHYRVLVEELLYKSGLRR